MVVDKDKIELTETDIETLETISIIAFRNNMEIYIAGLRLGICGHTYFDDKRKVFKVRITDGSE